jgi:DNA repair photolyase
VARCGFRCAWCGGCEDGWPPGEERTGATRARILGAGGEPPGLLLARSELVLRDAALLRDAGVAVEVSIPTLSAALARAIEPRAPSPERRLAVLRRLRREGVVTGLSFGPVAPGLNDRLGDLAYAASEARRAGALWFRVRVVRAPGEAAAALLAFIDRQRPGLRDRYLALLDVEGAPPKGWEERLLSMAASVRAQELLAGSPPAAGHATAGQLGLPFPTGYAVLHTLEIPAPLADFA